MKEIKILSPCGILGYGFPKESFLNGIAKKPDVIAVDAGSTDAGPHKLGAGVGIVSRRAAQKDLTWMLKYGYELGIPVIIGSAGGAGARPHVEWTLDIIEEIIKKEQLSFKTAIIYADIDKAFLRQQWRQQQVVPLGAAPELIEDTLERTQSIVGQMGPEPIMEALKQGAQLVVAGRAYDPAPFAAFPLLHGFDSALAIHLGKILECGALCAEPGTTKDAILGRIRADHFIVEPLNAERICSPLSVAAHTMYEKDHPYLLHGPGIELDLSACQFETYTEGAVKVSGSRSKTPAEYTIKLEGAAQVAYRTIVIAGMRDPILIAHLEEIQHGVVEQVRQQYDDIPLADYEVIFHVYGKNGVMGKLEPHNHPAHELGIVIEVVATTQELANTICASVRSTMLHYPSTGRKSTAGNLAFPYSPSDIVCGAVYKFTVYHLVTVTDSCELFKIEFKELG